MGFSFARAMAHFAAASVFAAAALAAGSASAQAPAKATAGKAAFDASACYGCHGAIKELHGAGKHKSLGCNACHDGTKEHLANASTRPTTKTDLANCGTCHQNQYKTYAQMNWNRTGRFEKKQYGGPAPDPSYDLLMSPHGFTKEHNLPRSHTFALLDQFVVDRAFGGRFGTKEGWRYLGGIRRHQRVGRRGRPLPRQHRPEGLQAGHGRRRECRVPVLQDAGPHPRLGVHGRSGPRRQMEPLVEGRRAREVVAARAQLHLLPRSARGEAADRARRADPGADAHRGADAVFAGPETDRDRRQGHGHARLHAEDRDAGTLRRQAAMRASATSSTTAIPDSIPTPAKRSRWPIRGPIISRSST